jgi:hypothetical protein
MLRKSLLMAAVLVACTGVANAADTAPQPAPVLTAGGVLGAPVAGPMSLTPAAAEALRRKVLVQCGLPPDQRDNLPWYFHFEYGRVLLDAGDARRAVGHLSQAVDMRPEPKAEERMYGMWFVDYLPYYQLASAHARLGNWPCASNALRLSNALGEPGFGVVDEASFDQLERTIDSHTSDVGACNKQDFLDPAYAAAAERIN